MRGVVDGDNDDDSGGVDEGSVDESGDGETERELI